MTPSKPAITVSSLDMDRLQELLAKLPPQTPGASALEAELDRADVLEPADMPAHVVTMNSTVVCTLVESRQSQTLTLVYPKASDGSPEKVSVLAPVGTALLGLSVGDTFVWPNQSGQASTLRVDAITYQPESAGQLHR